MNLKQLIKATPAINYLRSSHKLDAVVSLRLARLWRSVSPELDAYRKEEARLFQEMGTLNEATDRYEVSGKKKDKLYAQLGKMQEDEITSPIPPFAFDDIKPASPSADDILLLADAGLLVVNWDEAEAANEK